MSTSTLPRIAIIGAGPAGLTLARLLQQASHSVTIFELEKSFNARDQGGSVDLHRRMGQMVLVAAGLGEEFRKIARAEGEYDKLVRFDGTVALDEKAELEKVGKSLHQQGQEVEKPEVDRTAMRGMLLNSLEEGTVVWGKKVTSVIQAEDNNGYSIVFEDGAKETFNLVVGADGAWSKVRNILTDVKPHYSSVTIAECWSLNVDERNPWLSNFVGAGSMFMFDENRAIIAQRNGAGGIRSYASVRKPEDWYKTCGIDWTKPEEAKKALMEQYFDDCGDNLKRCIISSQDELIVRPLYMLPVSHKWYHRPGVTLIGDSAHLMTPFAGVGVNLALMDSFELAQAIIGSTESSLDHKIQEFEQSMFKRSEKYAQKTWHGLEGHFSKNGLKEREQVMRQRLEEFLSK
jgi:2-polyprenyl-6-methoxyphenol hydroxylase-like FAD-dependent oxidoreductase